MSRKQIGIAVVALPVLVLSCAVILTACDGAKESGARPPEMRSSEPESPRASARRSACVNNLKQIGLVLNMFANEHDGELPRIDNIKGNFMFECDEIYPVYLSDAAILGCPSDSAYYGSNSYASPRFVLKGNSTHPDANIGATHPDCMTCESYVYLGWQVTNETEGLAAIEAYTLASADDLGRDLTVPDGMGNAGGNIIRRLSRNTEESSTVPIIWEWPGHRDAEMANVLYLDGHVELILYPGKFPMTEKFIEALREIDAEVSGDCSPIISK